MSKIGNYVVGQEDGLGSVEVSDDFYLEAWFSELAPSISELDELIGSVMALEPFDDFFAIDEVYGCDYCGSDLCCQTDHSNDCPVVKLREVLTKQGSKA